MTGNELIEWIKEHHAEELKVVVQYRDSGGIYLGCDEEIVPCVHISVDREVIVL